jgi:hypothetical protein
MKRTASALTLILALLFSGVAGTILVKVTKANPFPTDPVISIESPANKTYNVNSLVLNITIVTKYDGYYFTSASRLVSYSIDGKADVPIAETDYSYDQDEKASTFNGSAILPELTNGPHNLTVYAKYDYDAHIIESQSSIYFTIDATSSSTLSPTPTPSGQPPLFPTTFVLASVVSVAVVGAGLIIYFKKRNH